MLKTPNSEGNDDSKQQSLPVSLHPDDAKDKVFTGILKALLKMNNKPSSPKELANVIMQSNFATLGGSTPFATVSSRISQHFKRAAQHKPPRSPLLARHIDSSHSRKINYSLAKDPIQPSPTPILSKKSQPQQKSVHLLYLENDNVPAGPKRTKRRRVQKHDALYVYDNKKAPKSKRTASSRKPEMSLVSSPINTANSVRDPQEDDSDYHQGMLNKTVDTFDATSKTVNSRPLLPLAIPQQLSDDSTSERVPDFPHMDGTNAIWINNQTVEDHFGLVRLPDSSTAHHLPFSIDAPESIPISELEDYFENDMESIATISSTSTRNNTHIYQTSSAQLSKAKDTYSSTEDANVSDSIFKNFDQRNLTLQRRHSWPTSYQQPISLDCENNCAVIATDDYNWNVNNGTHNIGMPQHPISNQVAGQICDDDDSKNTNAVANSTQHTASDSELSITTFIGDKYDDNVFFHFDDSDDEDNLRKDCPPTSPVRHSEPAAPSLNISTLTKLLELMHDNQADFTKLHQIITTNPDLNYLIPIATQIRSLAAYIHATTTKIDPNTSASSSLSITDSESTVEQQDADVNAIFTQFPILKSLFGKHNVQQIKSDKQQSTLQDMTIVKTITSTYPTMYITMIDDIAVCVATLPSTSDTPEYRIMRRLDMDYVNGTTLLKAGGIDLESERSVIFSLEKDRLRIRRRNSSLNGTWLPLKRALHLAATCSIQHRLGPFLDNNIESYFPSPLPVNIVKRQQTKPVSSKQHFPYSWKLNNDQEHSPPVLSRDISLTGSDSAFWTDAASDTSSLSCGFSTVGSIAHAETDSNDLQQQKPSIIPTTASTNTTCCTTNDDDSTDDSTDIDSDTEEVRRQAKRAHDAAINAMAEDTSLDELVNRGHQLKKRRKETLPKNNTIANCKAPIRRRKTPTRPNQTLTSGMIIRSASCNESISSRQPFSPASLAKRQPTQEISTYGAYSSSMNPSSTELSTFGEDEVEVDIGGHDLR